MTLRSSDLQSDSDLDSIRNSCDVFLRRASFSQVCCSSGVRSLSASQLWDGAPPPLNIRWHNSPPHPHNTNTNIQDGEVLEKKNTAGIPGNLCTQLPVLKKKSFQTQVCVCQQGQLDRRLLQQDQHLCSLLTIIFPNPGRRCP